jgi:hypothetical protein
MLGVGEMVGVGDSVGRGVNVGGSVYSGPMMGPMKVADGVGVSRAGVSVAVSVTVGVSVGVKVGVTGTGDVATCAVTLGGGVGVMNTAMGVCGMHAAIVNSRIGNRKMACLCCFVLMGTGYYHSLPLVSTGNWRTQANRRAENVV